MWIDESLLAPPPEVTVPKRGRPFVCTDALIQGLLGLKQVFRLPLCALQGFAQSLRKLAFPALAVPNYTTLRRRAQDLTVALPTLRTGEPLHLVIDSTGLKLSGEGEWKVRKHGWSKRRTWRNAVIGDIARNSRRDWKRASGHHRRSLVENLMYRLKTLTGQSLWARATGSRATEVSIRVGVLNRMAALARPQSVRIT